MIADHLYGPIEIFPRPDDKFHLICFSQGSDIGPKVFFHHATAGALEVDNSLDAGIDSVNIQAPSSLKKGFVSSIAQTREKMVNFWLKQGFSSGHFNDAASVAIHATENFINLQTDTIMKSVFGVAISAAEIAVR